VKTQPIKTLAQIVRAACKENFMKKKMSQLDFSAGPKSVSPFNLVRSRCAVSVPIHLACPFAIDSRE
jgi:hypothetical protein